MEFIMQVLFDTEWGAIIVGAIIFIALTIYFFNNNNTPQI